MRIFTPESSSGFFFSFFFLFPMKSVHIVVSASLIRPVN